MPAIQDSLPEEIASGFLRVCRELGNARHRLQQRDTPANRADVAACLARADVLLDMHLEIRDTPLRAAPVAAPGGHGARAVAAGSLTTR